VPHHIIGAHKMYSLVEGRNSLGFEVEKEISGACIMHTCVCVCAPFNPLKHIAARIESSGSSHLVTHSTGFARMKLLYDLHQDNSEELVFTYFTNMWLLAIFFLFNNFHFIQ
jgi:hypothetical protein